MAPGPREAGAGPPEGHPLGVQPWGNRLRGGGGADADADVRGGLGPVLGALDDATLARLFGRLAPADLGRLAAVSKAFRVFCGLEEVWRDRVFAAWGADFTLHPSGGWKRTFLARAFPGRPGLAGPPRRVGGALFSDLLYQPFHCATFKLPAAWLAKENVPRVAGLSKAAFRERFERPNRPCIVTDVVPEWPAFAKWDLPYLERALEGRTVHAGGYEFEPAKFFRYLARSRDEQPLYLFDKAFAAKAPQLAADYAVPHLFDDDLFGVLGEARPDWRWLIVGGERTGSIFHKDPNMTSAWNACVRGRKKWILFPPSVTPPGVFPSADGRDVATSLSIVEWLLNFYEEASGESRECVVGAGELIFVPRGWWHLVLNLEPSVAVTQNFCSEVNLPHVLKYVSDPRLVSGCPEDQRASLGDRFRAALAAQKPHLRLDPPGGGQGGEGPRGGKLAKLFGDPGERADAGGFRFAF